MTPYVNLSQREERHYSFRIWQLHKAYYSERWITCTETQSKLQVIPDRQFIINILQFQRTQLALINKLTLWDRFQIYKPCRGPDKRCCSRRCVSASPHLFCFASTSELRRVVWRNWRRKYPARNRLQSGRRFSTEEQILQVEVNKCGHSEIIVRLKVKKYEYLLRF